MREPVPATAAGKAAEQEQRRIALPGHFLDARGEIF